MVRRTALLIVLAVAAACAATAVSAPQRQGARSPLVGRWERVTTCQQLVAALRRAGLGATVAQAWVGQTSAAGESSFKPGSPKPTLAHPCTGAIPRVHSHFFTARGRFGSLDWKGGQVDDGPYRALDANTVQIGPAVADPDPDPVDDPPGERPPSEIHDGVLGGHRRLSGERLEARLV